MFLPCPDCARRKRLALHPTPPFPIGKKRASSETGRLGSQGHRSSFHKRWLGKRSRYTAVFKTRSCVRKIELHVRVGNSRRPGRGDSCAFGSRVQQQEQPRRNPNCMLVANSTSTGIELPSIPICSVSPRPLDSARPAFTFSNDKL